VVVKGQLRGREGQLQISCQHAQRFTPGQGNGRRRVAPRDLAICLKETEDSEADIALLGRVVELLRSYPGEDAVSLVIDLLDGRRVDLELAGIRVSIGPDLERALNAVLGESSYRAS